MCVCVCALHFYYGMRSLWDGGGGSGRSEAMKSVPALSASIVRVASLNFCPEGAPQGLTVLQTVTAVAAQLVVVVSV